MNLVPLYKDGLDDYLKKVHAIPFLSAEEEQTLARRYHEAGDLLAAQQLVVSHLRYVVRIARGYTGYGLALADLIQEGTIGLMKAVKRFDPNVGVRLVSFAVHWIKSEILEFVIQNWRIVKIATTKAQRKLFFNLRSQKEARKRLGWFSAAEVQAVANDLGVTPQQVLEMESCLNNAQEEGLEEEGSALSLSNVLCAPAETEPEQSVLHDNMALNVQEQLSEALSTLDPRSLDIVSHRWLNDAKLSLKELAKKYGISLERVRQLEKSAIEKLRHAMSLETMA